MMAIDQIQAFDPAWYEYLGNPPLGDLGLPFAVLVLVLLVLSLVGASVPSRMAGAVGSRERNRQWWIPAASTALRTLGLLSVVAGTAAMYFPLQKPVAVILPSSAGAVNASNWREVWDEAIERLGSDVIAIDAAQITQAVFDEVAAVTPKAGWDALDSTARLTISEITERKLTTELDDLKFSRVSEIEPRSELRLEPWVIESIELAVLKAITLRANTSAILLVYEPRSTDLGPALHEGHRQYLRADTTRQTPPRVWPVSVGEPPPVRLTQPERVQTAEGTQLFVTAQVRVKAAQAFNEAAFKPYKQAQVRSADGINSEEVILDLSQDAMLQRIPIPLTSIDLDKAIVIEHGESGSVLRLSEAEAREISADADAIVIAGSEERRSRWQATLSAIGEDRSFFWWQRAIKRSRLKAISRNNVSQAPDSSKIVVRDAGHYIWIARSGDLLTPEPAEGESADFATRVTTSVLPSGVFGWSGIQLGDTPLPDITKQTTGQHLASTFVSTPLTRNARSFGARRAPFEQTIPISREDGEVYLGTLIAIDAVDSNLLLHSTGQLPDGFNRAAAQTLQMSIARAVARAREPFLGAAAFSSPEALQAQPVVLLSDEQIDRLGASELSKRGLWIGLGLAGFAIGLIGQVRPASRQ